MEKEHASYDLIYGSGEGFQTGDKRLDQYNPIRFIKAKTSIAFQFETFLQKLVKCLNFWNPSLAKTIFFVILIEFHDTKFS